MLQTNYSVLSEEGTSQFSLDERYQNIFILWQKKQNAFIGVQFCSVDVYSHRSNSLPTQLLYIGRCSFKKNNLIADSWHLAGEKRQKSC